MQRPAFEIFRVIYSLSLSGPASTSLRRPTSLSPSLQARHLNRSCRVTPCLRLNGPVGVTFLATSTSSSSCAVLATSAISPPPSPTLTFLAKTNTSNFWILGLTREDISGLEINRQVCSGEPLPTHPLAAQVQVSNLASSECRKCSPHGKDKPTPNFISSSGVPRTSEYTNNLPATRSTPRNLDTVAAYAAIVHATPTSVHHRTPEV